MVWNFGLDMDYSFGSGYFYCMKFYETLHLTFIRNKKKFYTYPTGTFVDFFLAKLTDISGVSAVTSVSRGGQSFALPFISARISTAGVKFLRTEFSDPT